MARNKIPIMAERKLHAWPVPGVANAFGRVEPGSSPRSRYDGEEDIRIFI